MQQKFKGKYVSILGDSISTLDGYNPAGYGIYYGRKSKINNDVQDFKDTYWGKLINYLNANLLVNNSYSGSTVVQEFKEMDFHTSVSPVRINHLNSDTEEPDLIIFYMGANDYYRNKPCEYNFESKFDFVGAYYYTLNELLLRYPKAEIWCITFPCGYEINSNEVYGRKNSYGTPKEKYIDAIIDVVNEVDSERVVLLNLHVLNRYYETKDGVHPTKKGMDDLFEMIKFSINESHTKT